MNWYVLYVKSRTEKKVTQRLAEKGFEVFCPLKKEKHQWSDRVKEVEVPYFRSYVFARFDEKDTGHILQTPGVVQRLFWLGKPAVIKDGEMEEVKRFFTDHPAASIKSVTYRKGEEVYIEKGCFKNHKAVVLHHSGTTISLYIPALNSGFEVIVPKENLKKHP